MVVKKFGCRNDYPLRGLASANWVCDSIFTAVRFVSRQSSVVSSSHTSICFISKLLGCYMVKPHGQLVWVSLRLHRLDSLLFLSQALGLLVPVSSGDCSPSTPGLSTLWSTRGLTRLLYERPHLKAGFTLRCFQRLSFPNVATQLYPWRDNWYTIGSSTPVLSY